MNPILNNGIPLEKDGYTLEWRIDGKKIGYPITIIEDTTIKAHWIPKTYSLRLDGTGTVTIKPDKTVSFPIKPTTKYFPMDFYRPYILSITPPATGFMDIEFLYTQFSRYKFEYAVTQY
jgi:hypothetical protein